MHLGSSSTIGMVFHQTFHKSIQHFFIKNASVHLPKILDYNNDESLWVSICEFYATVRYSNPKLLVKTVSSTKQRRFSSVVTKEK